MDEEIAERLASRGRHNRYRLVVLLLAMVCAIVAGKLMEDSLLALTDLQKQVGAELRAESTASASSMNSLLYFQLGIAFVLGLISSGLAVGLRPSTGRRSTQVDPNLH